MRLNDGVWPTLWQGPSRHVELVAQHLPKSQMSEAFRALRTLWLLSQPVIRRRYPSRARCLAKVRQLRAANLAVTLAQLATGRC